MRCFRGRGEGIYDHVFMLGVEALGIGYHLTASPDENSLSTVLTPFTWLTPARPGVVSRQKLVAAV